MNNARKRMIRRGLSALGGLLLVFSGVIYAGVQFPFFNIYSPLYNPYYFVIISIVLFIGRTYIKEKRMIWNSLGFFEPSGLTTMHDVAPENVGLTHITYQRPDGERGKVKHHHPFAIPSEEGYDNVYLTPKSAVESLDPRRLWHKYSGVAGIGEEVKKKLLDHYEQMTKLWPEMESLDPHMLTINETESDDPDTLNQELATTVSDIRRGFLGLSGVKQYWFYLFAGVAMGALAMAVILMTAGVNFSGIV